MALPVPRPARSRRPGARRRGAPRRARLGRVPVTVPVIRPASAADAEVLTALRVANRTEFRRWEPDSDDPESWYTVDGVRAWITDGAHRFVILDGGDVAGLVSLSGSSAAHSRRRCWATSSGRSTRARGSRRRRSGRSSRSPSASSACIASKQAPRLRMSRHNECSSTMRSPAWALCVVISSLQGEWVDHLLWERLADD